MTVHVYTGTTQSYLINFEAQLGDHWKHGFAHVMYRYIAKLILMCLSL